MWDRLRSATGGGGSGSPVDQYQERLTPLGRKDRASTLPTTTTISTASSTSSTNSTPSWQPRSSVIAARQGQQQQQQPPQLQQQQQQQRPPPPRPPREFEYRSPVQQPTHQRRSHTVPLTAAAAAASSSSSLPQGRPPSSVYSQPSPLMTDFGARATNGNVNGSMNGGPAYRYTMSPDDVSPPSSPEDTRDKATVPNHDISPIDEEDGNDDDGNDDDHDNRHSNSKSPALARPLPQRPIRMASPTALASLPSQQRRNPDPYASQSGAAVPSTTGGTARSSSNIPTMRRERRAQRHTSRNTTATDKPREEDRGIEEESSYGHGHGHDTRRRPAQGQGGQGQARPPVEYARGLGISTMASSSSATTGSHGGPRPDWKGASGRTAIVDPVRDDPRVAPLKIPPRSRRREAGGPPTKDEQQAQQAQQVQQVQQVQHRTSSGHAGEVGGGGGKTVHFGDVVLLEKKKHAVAVSPGTGPEKVGDGAGNSHKSQSHVVDLSSSSTSAASKRGGSPPASAPTSTGRSLASTIRSKIMSVSSAAAAASSASGNTSNASSARTSRLFRAGSSRRNTPATTPDGSSSSPTSAGADPEHKDPAPLSGSPVSGSVAGVGGGSSPVNAHANAHNDNNASISTAGALGNAKAANTAKTDSTISTGSTTNTIHTTHTTAGNTANSSQHASAGIPSLATSAPEPSSTAAPPLTSHHHHHQHLDLHHNLAHPAPPQPPPQSIRRKELGAGTPTSQHRPLDSFSSSVYSRPDDNEHDDDHDDSLHQQPRPPYKPRQPPSTAPLNTKNLPRLPTGLKSSTDSPYVQPPSRFSITTYATSAHTSAHTSSPRESVDVVPPPLPTPPNEIVLGLNTPQANQAKTSPDMAATSVLDRQRPQMRGGTNTWQDPSPADENDPPVKISLSKAWMTTAGANSSGKSQQVSPPRTRHPKGPRELAPTTKDNSNNNNETRGMFGFGFLGPKSPASPANESHASRPASILSNMDKDLPPAPVPAQAPSDASTLSAVATTTNDRIAQLNAQLQDLANRRLNIHRAIRQMTELMPQDNLIMQDAVRRKREDEKRKIEELKRKLDDIQREEHELGMKLHRAYKKLDQQTEYEPTTLWVRRATGS